MRGYLIPSKQAVAELQRTHKTTFAIEIKDSEPLILYLKLTPTQTLSVINGAPIDLIIGSPVFQPNTITIRLNDVIDSPFCITRPYEKDHSSEHVTYTSPLCQDIFSGYLS